LIWFLQSVNRSKGVSRKHQYTKRSDLHLRTPMTISASIIRIGQIHNKNKVENHCFRPYFPLQSFNDLFRKPFSSIQHLYFNHSTQTSNIKRGKIQLKCSFLDNCKTSENGTKPKYRFLQKYFSSTIEAD